MAIVWRVSANPLYILTNNDVPDLSNAKITVNCYQVDDATQEETLLPTFVNDVMGTNCTAYREVNVATITRVTANSGELELHCRAVDNYKILTVPFFVVKLIGKGQITITLLDDGYTINCTPSSIVIPANADGSNPILTGAKTRVLLSKAGVNIPVAITSIVATGCTAIHATNEATITTVSALTGNLQIHFKATGDPYESYVNVPFSTSKNGNDGLPGQNGKDGISVILSNEAHALPANHDGSVSQASIDTAVCTITVLKGSMPLTPVAANATPGIGQFRYNVDSVTGGTALRVNNNSFKLATISASTCVIKVLIYAESLNNPIQKEMVITKVIGSDPTEFNEVKNIFDDWKFADSTEIDGAKIRTGTLTADKIVSLVAFAQALFAEEITAEQLIVTGNSEVGPFKIDENGLYISSEVGTPYTGALRLNKEFIKIDSLEQTGMTFKNALLELFNSNKFIKIHNLNNHSKNIGLHIEIGSSNVAIDIVSGSIRIDGSYGNTIKQAISTPSGTRYLNFKEGIMVGVTTS